MSEIWVPCEGSNCPTHSGFFGGGLGMCPMCGQGVSTDENGKALAHVRDDILARIKRGDFK